MNHSINIKPYWQNYIDGQFVDGGDGRIKIHNPANGEVIAEHACADEHDVNHAVNAAKKCHQSRTLTSMRPVERGRMVKKIGAYLLQHQDEIAPILTLESGKPLWEAYKEIQGAARYFEYYGNQAETIEGKSIPLGDQYIDFTLYEPYGVSAHIIPWNYPLEMTARSLSAALTTGNSVVVKTPELDPITNFYIIRAVENAGFPKGAVNILCGIGNAAGAALSAHPDVNQISFTGSVKTGAAIAKAAAQNIVPCTLELGGKSAAIIYPDADIENLMHNIRWGIFFNAGQVCSALSRLIVHESVHDHIIENAIHLAQSINVDDGIKHTQFGPNMGSMISNKQRDRALNLCINAQKQGAKIETGGHKLNRKGAFLEPTVFSNVTPEMTIAQEEVFAPVLSVMKFNDDQEALNIANKTEYGLVGGVFTQNINKALTVANHLRAGQIFINEWFAGGVETPFGGYGKSGYGREKGREALWNYLQTKNVAIKLQ